MMECTQAALDMETQLCFPITTVDGILSIFKMELQKDQPNLAFLSLVSGIVENYTTDPKQKGLEKAQKFPTISLEEIEFLYLKYLTMVERIRTELESRSLRETLYANRDVIKFISSFVWGQIKKGFFKDKPHIQTIRGLVTGGNLDCFGIAYSVVAIAQTLGYSDVHLALSEDHSWITFGENGAETAEVTWYGKGNDLKLGMPIDFEQSNLKCNWLYLGSHEIKCGRHMEIAALVSSMNPGINSKTDSELLGSIQQSLLWLLYNKEIIDMYPMALCNLADLEEIESTRSEPSIETLYQKAVKCSQEVYDDYHVYPYTYYGGYLFRQGRYQEAVLVWRDAARTASRYCHSGESEELYKDFAEIITTFLPIISKESKQESLNVDKESNFFHDEKNFMNFVSLFDWLCLWEEHSKASVVHNDWAKTFVSVTSSFPSEIRQSIEFILCSLDNSDNKRTQDQRAATDTGIRPNSKEENTVSGDGCKTVEIRSAKISEVTKHLNDQKLNNSAIKLHLTAPISNIGTKKSRTENDFDGYGLVPERKRGRRHEI